MFCSGESVDHPPLCEQCATRRVERKEIITEIIETEIKYGRDLRIIYEEFYRPMIVAGLLAPDQLANIFLNVEELIQVNVKFTESLKDAIEIALDQGDEDMCTVSIGKLFLEASPMLGAFKSYCTRQVRVTKWHDEHSADQWHRQQIGETNKQSRDEYALQPPSYSYYTQGLQNADCRHKLQFDNNSILVVEANLEATFAQIAYSAFLRSH